MFFCFSLFSKPLFFQYSISPLFCQFYTSVSCEPFCDRRLAHPAALACHLRLSDNAAAAPIYRIPLRLFVWLFVCLVRTLWARAAAASVARGVPRRMCAWASRRRLEIPGAWFGWVRCHCWWCGRGARGWHHSRGEYLVIPSD